MGNDSAAQKSGLKKHARPPGNALLCDRRRYRSLLILWSGGAAGYGPPPPGGVRDVAPSPFASPEPYRYNTANTEAQAWLLSVGFCTWVPEVHRQ